MSAHLARRAMLGAGLALAWGACGPVRAQAQTAGRAASGLTMVEPGSLPAAPLWSATFTDLHDRPAPLKPRAGRAMVVNFWARWCAPCRVEIPELVALKARALDVDVVGINIEADAEPVRDFARAYEIDYPVHMAREGGLELMRALGNPKAGLPFTLVLDRQARIVALRLGVLTRAHLDAAVQRATA